MDYSGKFCKCPYCFGRFVPDTVAFKAKTVYTKQDLEDFTESELVEKKKYIEAPDELYENFWKKFPGSAPKFAYAKHAIISKLDSRYITKASFQNDADGFLIKAIDTENQVTDIRVCPHCHNSLPAEFGKYPVRYISVVGVTSSGKTVYLSQLLSKLEEFLTKAGMTVVGTHDELDDFIKNYRIVRGQPLPQGTTANLLTMPIPINVKNNATGAGYTLIFYDIAGENCVNPEAMEKYGQFIENADGIVMIIDPGQFSGLFMLNDAVEDDEVYSPKKVAEAMYTAFGSSQNASGKSNVPVAAAISKSDLLKGIIQDNSNIFHNVDYDEYAGYGFPLNAGRDIHTEIEMMLNNKKSMQGVMLVNALRMCFPVHSFFSFSALNCATSTIVENGQKYSIIDVDPQTVRVEEPILWLLYKMGIIPSVRKKDEVSRKKGLFGWSRR